MGKTSPGVLSQSLEHLERHVVAQRVCGNDEVGLVLLHALPEAFVARQVRQDLSPPPIADRGGEGGGG